MRKKLFTTAGVLLTLGVLLSFVLWFNVTLGGKLPFDAARQSYLSLYPPFLRNARTLTALLIALNVLAIICLLQIPIFSTKLPAPIKFFIILNLTMIFWQIFSLM